MNGIDSSQAATFANLGLTDTTVKQDRTQLGQGDFLELMITQLKNQDPFKPMENGDFIAQMAQFSSVTGLEKLQNSFSAFATSMQSNQALQASAMVGREVVFSSSHIALADSGASTGFVDLPHAQQNVRVGILNQKGELVRNLPLGDHIAGSLSYSWDGLDETGNRLPPGNYQVAALAGIGEDSIGLETFASARVDSVSLNQQTRNITLNLKDLGSVSFSAIREIR